MFKLIKRLFRPKIDFAKLVQEGALIVDVRTIDEYRAGHLDTSRNIPLDQIKNEINTLKKSGKPVITVCRSGNRSGIARSILKSAGVEAYNGGAWTNLKKQIQ